MSTHLRRPVALLLPALLTTLAAGGLFLASPAGRQEPAGGQEQRIDRLETRLESLESVLFASRQIDLRDARRRLEQARQQLADSRALFNQGVLADSQLEQDRFQVLIAEQELELAAHPGNHRRLVCQLDLLDAQRRLETAKQNLRFSETLNNRGFGSLTRIENSRHELAAAEESLRWAEQQLAAVEVLGESPPKTPPPAPSPPAPATPAPPPATTEAGSSGGKDPPH